MPKAQDTARFTAKLRELLRGRQKEVSDATGIPHQTIKGIAGGKGTTPQNWEAIAEALEKQIEISDA